MLTGLVSAEDAMMRIWKMRAGRRVRGFGEALGVCSMLVLSNCSSAQVYEMFGNGGSR